MRETATVEGDEPLRLFYGLPLPPEAAHAVAAWAQSELAGFPTARLVPEDQLHLTLVFVGTRPRRDLVPLLEVLQVADGWPRPLFAVEGYRETPSVAMLVLADEDGRAGALQAALAHRLEERALHRGERRPWLPHVTVARLGGRVGAQPTLPQLGTFSPSDAALYHSLLRPEGAQYHVLEAVALGG